MVSIKVISTEKKLLMGMAIFLIMLFHSSLLPVPCIEPVFRYGDVGVEIFALLSGLGVYFSLSKDNRVLAYYKRRVLRLLPPFLLVSITLGIFQLYAYHATWSHFISLITGFAPFRGDYTFWFVSFIGIFYILSPFLFRILQKMHIPFLYSAITFVLSYLISLIVNEFNDALMWIPRFAVFTLGMEIGKYIYKSNKDEEYAQHNVPRELMQSACVVILICSCLSITDFKMLYIRYILHYIIVCPLTVSLAILLAHASILRRMLSFMGDMSLELYLVHQHICIPIAGSIASNPYIITFVSILLAIGLAFSISLIIKLCIR